MIEVTLPVRIESEANKRCHWAVKRKRTAVLRQAGYLAARLANTGAWTSYTVTLTRIAPRKLDGDNLQSGCKAFRDGVADFLGIDDGSDRLTWRYAQERGKPKEYAVRLEITGH
jgi:crossover junction endodeoxyribonuclease RusA